MQAHDELDRWRSLRGRVKDSMDGVRFDNGLVGQFRQSTRWSPEEPAPWAYSDIQSAPRAKREIDQWPNVLQPSFIGIPESGGKAAQLCNGIENLPQDLFIRFPQDLASHDPLKV